ncbi:MAG: Ig-like domain-containing protein [Chloroflexi bacterium]|nr:Ig-like domain-containing protein [Chloroflexota bacterium]
MENKKLLGALGILGVIIVAVVVAAGLFISNKAATPSIKPQPAGPRVIGQVPAEGERLDASRSDSIQIQFDSEMDVDKTGSSFSISANGGTVSGQLTWDDARTLTFTPDSPLEPGTVYTATITEATSKDGVPADDTIKLEFKTLETLAVAQVFPAADTPEVDLNTSITVIFNHPVVPLTIVEEQDKLPQPLKFKPEVKGKGEWVNSSVYVFQPDEILLSGTSYQVSVEKGLKDTLGNALDKSHSWQFSTRAPSIYNFALKDGVQNPTYEVTGTPLDQTFIVTFLQPMDQQSVETATSIVNRETKQPTPLKFTWDDESTSVTIKPKEKLKIASFYDLILAESAAAKDGGTLSEGLKVQLATVPFPAVKEVYPPANADGGYHSSITITFVSPMDFDSLKGRVKISPSAAPEAEWYYNTYGNTLTIGGLEPAANYVVRLLPGMVDPYGNTIKDEFSYTFYNGDYSPYTRLALPWTPLVYRAKGAQDVYFEHLNVEEASVSVYPITSKEFYKLTSNEISLTAFAPNTKAIREWEFGKSKQRNILKSEHLDLAQDGKPLEAGFYFIGTKAQPFNYDTNFYQGYVFVVATDNLTFKATSTEGLAWLTDLESGVPQKDVQVKFYNEKFAEIGKAVTDKDGLAYAEDIKSANYALAESDGHFAFTALYWGSDVSSYDFGIYQNYYSGTERLYAYLYTDRPIYRPNQEVFFKGILRNNDDLHYSLPDQAKVHLVVEQWGNKIFAEDVTVNKQGSFSGSVTLGQDVSLGYYTIYVYRTSNPDESPISSVSFNVAEYKKPEFEVSVAPDKEAILAGGSVNFGLDAEYYSGGILKNARTSWFIESSTFYFTPSSKYSQFSFMDWDRDMYWESNQSANNKTVDEGEGVTDQNGHLNVQQTFGGSENKISQQMRFYANVTDVAGNTVSGGTSVVVHQSEYYAGIRSDKYIGKQGEAQPFSVVVLDWDSKPVAGKKVTVDFVERQWFSVQEEDKQGQLKWVTTVKEIPAGKQEATTGADGTAQVEFTPPNGGVFKALVTVRDSKGNTHQSSTYIWVASPGQISWRQTNDRAFSLIADKDMYEPGDTAEILIAQPFTEKVYALITYERGHIYKQEVVQLEGNSTIYKLPITDEMAPIAYISVTVISGAEQSGKPDFKIGMTKINIDTKQKTLDVSVTADKDLTGPGDEVTYTIETKDIDGKPVSADVSIAVVDKAVLALAPSNTRPLLASFYSIQSLSVSTALGIVSSADDYNENYRATMPDGLAAGGGGGGEPGVITVRQNFKDTAIFKAELTTDEDGKAQVKVEMPENLTTWVSDVRAVTADSRVGEATNEVVSTKPLFVQLQTPRFFVVGDQATVGATVFNNSEENLKVNVSLDAEGVALKSEAKQTVEVEGRQQAYVTWDVVINNDAERVDMTATATSGKFTDASKPAVGTLSGQGIPVLRYTAVEAVGTSGMISSADSVTENIQLPTSFDFEDASLSIEVAPSLATSLESSFTYLEQYPYYCLEQTVSRFLPNVITTRALKAAGKPTPLEGDLDAQVSAALQKIYSTQLYDGGWSWWGNDESNAQMTAYVVYGLLEAKESGYEVSQSVLDNGIAYLKDNLPDLKRNDASWKYNRHAFMLYVLARANELGAGQVNFIFEHRASLDQFGKAYLAQAMHMLGDGRESTLMSDLVSSAILSSSGAHWEETSHDYWNWNTDTRTTAIVLNAFVQIDPQNPITVNAVRWLMAHRDGGHWYSTQETTWSLIALTNWLVESKEFETDYKYAVGLNDEMLQKGQANADNLSEALKLQVELEDLLKDQVNALVFSRGNGTGNLYYTAYLNATLPVEEVQPLDQGMSLSREYFTLDDPKKPITEIERGELVRVRLTVVVPDSVHYVVVEDPLPAGLEALDASLATDTVVPSSYTVQDYKERGWGWWYFSHIELRDEKVVLSTDYLPAGTYVYTYLARASSAGTFKVIPPTASEFYFPDVGGRGAGSLFTVK